VPGIRFNAAPDRVQNGSMLFVDLVAVLSDAEGLDARTEKVGRLGTFLRELSPTDASVCTELLLRGRLFDGTEGTPDDFGAVEPRDHPTLSCEHLADVIAEIDQAPAEALRRSLIQQVMAQATRDEQHWIGVALGHEGLDRPTFDLIVSSAATAARVTVGSLRRAATLAGSLPLAVRIAFERGESGLESVAFEPGRPIPPTVAEGTEPPTGLLDMETPSLVEWKLRADRIQVHRLRGAVSVYDEQLNDVTGLVPVVVDQVASLRRDDLVLDGWVDIDRRSSSESSAVASWSRRSGARNDPGRALFFDVLFDGAPVVDEPLSSRRRLLTSIVPADSLMPTVEVGDLDAVAAAMNEAVRLGHEGLVVKPLDAPYEGGLTKSSWRTVDASHVVKLIVTAARRGTGSRSHLLSTVYLAARDEQGRLHEVGRTARGLSEELIIWQTGLFAELMIEDEEVESSRPFALRPEAIAVVAIDGVGTDPDTGALTLRQPSIIGYQQGGEIEVASLAELADLRDVGAGGDDDGDADAEHDGTADELPQLPRLPARGPAQVRSTPSGGIPRPTVAESFTLPMGSRPQTTAMARRSVADADFAPYEEPVMPRSRGQRPAVVAARVVALAWVLAMLAAALIARSDSGNIDGTTLSLIGRVGGIVVTVLLVVSGWAWSDHLVRTLTRLDGRRPNRVRCVTAWLTPPIVVFFNAIVVVPIEPTETVDVRPAIIVVSFAFAMWRPYALIRRILFTLTRLRSDGLIASVYIIDALSFGFLWWRLTLLAQSGTDVSRGEIDILVGAIAATAISIAMGLLVWLGVLNAADKAVAHRRASQRTRYEHRMLRLRGVDPTDPEVWWALVQRRADEQRAAEAELEAGDDRAELPSVDELIESTRREHTVAFRRLGADESLQLEQRLLTEFSAILGGAPPATDPDQRSAEAAPGNEELVARGPNDHPAPALPGVPAIVGRTDPDESSRTLGRDDDPIDAIRRRVLRKVDDTRDRSDIEMLISRAGSLQIDAALAAHRDKAREERPAERLVPPRIFAIEMARLATVTTFGALTLAAALLVITSMGSDAAAGTNRLPSSVVSDLELGRKIFWSLLTVGAALIPLWSLTILRRARRAGVPGLRERRVVVLATVAAVACAAGFVFDRGDRGGLTLLLAIPIIWSAVSAGFCVEPARAWFELPSATLTACIATLPVIFGVAWLAGLGDATAPSASLQRLAFTTILLALGCARVTVMFVLTSLDLEDALRVSPELAVPAHDKNSTSTSTTSSSSSSTA
jgi:ATP-dependent DNA ligase